MYNVQSSILYSGSIHNMDNLYPCKGELHSELKIKELPRYFTFS